MAAIIAELKWLHALLVDLSVRYSRSIPLFCKSRSSALYIAQNPMFGKRIKHIEVDYHFVHNAIIGFSLFFSCFNS